MPLKTKRVLLPNSRQTGSAISDNGGDARVSPKTIYRTLTKIVSKGYRLLRLLVYAAVEENALDYIASIDVQHEGGYKSRFSVTNIVIVLTAYYKAYIISFNLSCLVATS
ncbi:uncharacterized protein MYCFIDRAFT_84733 [Pseudocercospora fijiensis CIRAD86]|uniref:Uncharacterized protein n=1 Tax=Pseudocercospora fijiensis (strain CIRAD86) TaxID=383855 RepID=M3AHR5_PSEFD|nr:uncharacterized protein MYCFIDRAFT_84733 [Pseudocercospora fijiensis CIRAD86]EME77057.1 hypothetical protein MYCFIDRAFT_84733 [Pseudocercospora fijiensis CIRAD86]